MFFLYYTRRLENRVEQGIGSIRPSHPESFRPGRTKSRHDLLTRRTGVHDRTHADRAPSASQDMMLSLPPFTTSTQVTRLASKEFGGLREVERQCEKKTRSKQPYEGNNRGKAE